MCAVVLSLLLGTAGFSTGLTGRVLAAMAAGPVNTLGTLLVMASVELSGMTIVFPIVVGIEMAIGTTMLWLIERRESPGLLFTGVAFALCAVYMDFRSHNEARSDSTSNAHGRGGSDSLTYAALTVGGNADDGLSYDDVEDDPFSSDLSDLNKPYKMGRRSHLSRKIAAASGTCSGLQVG